MTKPFSREYHDIGLGYVITAADILDLEPRALFSERRAMERMGQARLGVHLIMRPWLYRLPFWITRLYWHGTRRGKR